MKKPKFELTCSADGGTTKYFVLKNVSSVIASNINVVSFDLVSHDKTRHSLLGSKMRLPTSLRSGEHAEFEVSHPKLQHRSVGDHEIEFVFTTEDEDSNVYRCIAIRKIEDNRQFQNVLGLWDSKVISESESIVDNITETQAQIKTLSQQAYERFESAKRQFEDVDGDERARKDAVRSCVDAMEALIKELGGDNEIGEATKQLKDDKDSQGNLKWGPVEIVKDGNNLFNELHRLYPDVRHGTQDFDTANMTMEEAEYFVGRVMVFMKYIAARAKRLGLL